MNYSNMVETLGGIVRTVNMLFAGKKRVVGNGSRMNLLIPACLGDGKSIKHGEACILAATPAVVGELLWVDDHLLDDPTIRNMFRVFIVAAFQPPIIGGGEFVIEESKEGIIFNFRN